MPIAIPLIVAAAAGRVAVMQAARMAGVNLLTRPVLAAFARQLPAKGAGAAVFQRGLQSPVGKLMEQVNARAAQVGKVPGTPNSALEAVRAPVQTGIKVGGK